MLEGVASTSKSVTTISLAGCSSTLRLDTCGGQVRQPSGQDGAPTARRRPHAKMDGCTGGRAPGQPALQQRCCGAPVGGAPGPAAALTSHVSGRAMPRSKKMSHCRAGSAGHWPEGILGRPRRPGGALPLQPPTRHGHSKRCVRLAWWAKTRRQPRSRPSRKFCSSGKVLRLQGKQERGRAQQAERPQQGLTFPQHAEHGAGGRRLPTCVRWSRSAGCRIRQPSSGRARRPAPQSRHTAQMARGWLALRALSRRLPRRQGSPPRPGRWRPGCTGRTRRRGDSGGMRHRPQAWGCSPAGASQACLSPAIACVRRGRCRWRCRRQQGLHAAAAAGAALAACWGCARGVGSCCGGAGQTREALAMWPCGRGDLVAAHCAAALPITVGRPGRRPRPLNSSQGAHSTRSTQFHAGLNKRAGSSLQGVPESQHCTLVLLSCPAPPHKASHQRTHFRTRPRPRSPRSLAAAIAGP